MNKTPEWGHSLVRQAFNLQLWQVTKENMGHACNLSLWEAEAGGSLHAHAQHSLHSKSLSQKKKDKKQELRSKCWD